VFSTLPSAPLASDGIVNAKMQSGNAELHFFSTRKVVLLGEYDSEFSRVIVEHFLPG
jgi:hypothetical protein